MSTFKLKPYIERLERGENIDALCDEIRRLPLSDAEQSLYTDRLRRAADDWEDSRHEAQRRWKINFSALIIGGVLLGLGLMIYFVLDARGAISVLPVGIVVMSVGAFVAAFRRSD